MPRHNGRPFIYRSFILRCWYEGTVTAEGQPLWRFSLAPVGGPESQRGFSCLNDLMAYLRGQLGAELSSAGAADNEQGQEREGS